MINSINDMKHCTSVTINCSYSPYLPFSTVHENYPSMVELTTTLVVAGSINTS